MIIVDKAQKYFAAGGSKEMDANVRAFGEDADFVFDLLCRLHDGNSQEGKRQVIDATQDVQDKLARELKAAKAAAESAKNSIKALATDKAFLIREMDALRRELGQAIVERLQQKHNPRDIEQLKRELQIAEETLRDREATIRNLNRERDQERAIAAATLEARTKALNDAVEQNERLHRQNRTQAETIHKGLFAGTHT